MGKKKATKPKTVSVKQKRKPAKRITTHKSERIIKRAQREVRKLIESTENKTLRLIAQVVEDAIRWTLEETHGWHTPAQDIMESFEVAGDDNAKK